jgi:hypothetical protein
MLDENEILSLLKAPLEKFADRSAKWLLANTDNLQGLLEIIGSDIVASLDFSKVQRVNTTFIADNLREQESDMVFLLPFRDADETEVMIYILIEHQSTVDPAMGFRLLFYMCQIWDQQRQKWVSENVPKREWRFRPIIPVLFYTGEERWQTLPSLETLMDVPEALTLFIPQFETLFLGVKSASDETLLKTDRPFGWLMTMLKQEFADEAAFIAALVRLGVHLDTLNDADKALWKQAIYYLYLLIFCRRSSAEREKLEAIVSEHQKSLQLSAEEAKQMQTIAEYYLEQGIEQGARANAIQNILAVLQTRFTERNTQSVEQALETIHDLDYLTELHLTALRIPNFEDFLEVIKR